MLGQRRWNFSEIEPNGNTDATHQWSRLDGIMAVKILPTHVADRAEVQKTGQLPAGGNLALPMLLAPGADESH
jgi:hypothetical protein